MISKADRDFVTRPMAFTEQYLPRTLKLSRRLHELFKIVFDAIGQLMATLIRDRKAIRFRSESVRQ